MKQDTLYVGLDTDKRSIDVAVAEEMPSGEVRYWGRIANEPASVDRLVKQLQKGRRLVVCYEAGPCGYGLYRQLNGKRDVSCMVVAPGLIPRQSGERVKTNRRDALKLARLLRAQELTAVWVPDETHEAMRDLVRARENAVEDVRRCQQRISSFVLKQGLRYVGKPWTQKHRRWLSALSFAVAAHRLMFGELLEALRHAEAVRDRLTDHIADQAGSWSLRWLVEALQELRGYKLINAATIVAEIGDPRRFANPRQLMGYVGMGVSEYSSGDQIVRGGITKTGNRRARKALIAAAWTYSRPGKALRAVDTSQPAEVLAIAEKARHRLSRRYRVLRARGKHSTVAVTAVARESLGFIWAIAHAAAPQAAAAGR